MWPGNKIPAPWANTTEPRKLTQVRKTTVSDKASPARTLLFISPTENQYRCLECTFFQKTEDTTVKYQEL